MFANLNPCSNRRFFGSKYAWGVSPLKNTVGGLQKYSRMPACHSPKLGRACIEAREASPYQSCSRISGSSQRSISMEWC
jgi:hypothetical protein